MITQLRRLITPMLIIFAIAIGLVAIPAPTADAIVINKYSQLSKGRRADLAAANAIQKKALNKSHTTLNYKKANTYDKGRTTARRKFAAGFLWAGGKVTNISKAELAKVRKYTPKKKRPYRVRTGDARGPVCTGRTRVVDVYVKGPAFDLRYWFNSCDTDVIMTSMDSAAVMAGVIALFVPPSAPVSGAVAGFLLIGKNVIGVVQRRSPVDAVVIRDYTHILTVYAQ